MTEKKNKLLALLVLCVLLLSSCLLDDTENDDLSSYSGGPSYTDGVSSTDETSDDRTDKIFTQAQKEILSLVEEDSRIISLFLLGEVAPDVPADYSYYLLPESSEYRRYDALVDLLSSVYSPDSDVIDRLLTYPTAAGAIIKVDGDDTVICKTYLPDYTLVPDTENADFVESDAFHAKFTVPASDGREYTFTAAKHDGEWFLENSLFLLWLDGRSDVKWEDSGLKPGQNEGSANLSLYVTDKRSSVYLKTSRNITTSMEDYLWIEFLFADTTYRNLEGCVSSYFDLDEYDNWCVLLHINKTGRSYALACNSTFYDYNIYSSERAVMYYSTDTDYTYYSVAGTYAHELLHLFGADDLYDNFISPDAAEALEHFYPNAIMSVVGNDMEMFGICPYTAYLIGWIDSIPEPFDRLLIPAG